MFGYDTGVISGVLVLITDNDLGQKLSKFDKELVTSITSLGALFGSIWAGISSDRIGRRLVIIYSLWAFILATVIMSFARKLSWLVMGRLIVGLAIGSASTSVPIYIAELSPARHRGKMVALNSISTTGGQVLAYLAAAIFSRLEHSWRIVVGLGAIPPIIFLFIAVIYFPESPRFLLHQDKVEQAEEALSKLYPDSSREEIREILQDQLCDGKDDESNKYNLFSLFSVKSNRKAILVACGVMAAQQLCGFNVFMYYSATIFSIIGFKNPLIVSLIVSCTNFIFTWPAIFYIDTVGRRKMLLGTMWVLILSLITTAFTFKSGNYALIISTAVYVASYAVALGNVPWQSTEFLPLNVRALGSMLISSTNWICNTLVSMTFLSMLDLITPKFTFLFYALITTIAYIGIYFYYPEVAGMSLEEISKVFDNDDHVYTQIH